MTNLTYIDASEYSVLNTPFFNRNDTTDDHNDYNLSDDENDKPETENTQQTDDTTGLNAGQNDDHQSDDTKKDITSKEYTELVSFYEFPNELTDMYNGLKMSIEIKIENAILFSLNKMFDLMKMCRSYGQNEFIDIGCSYMGMGHIQLLSWHKLLHKFFIRNDGGSNGYEREDNFKYYIMHYNGEYDGSAYEIRDGKFVSVTKKMKGFCVSAIENTYDLTDALKVLNQEDY